MTDKNRQEIKIITIGIESVPKGFCNPLWLKIKPDRVKVSTIFTEGLDITTMEDTNIKLEYPLKHFAVDSDRMSFYIREKDEKAFLELINGIIKRREREAVEGFVRWVVLNKNDLEIAHDLQEYLSEQEEREE